MPGFAVDTGQLELAVADLERVTEALVRACDDADAAVERMHGGWEGDAASSHTAAHAAWSDDAREMHAALARMRAVLETARTNYAAAVATNTGMWS